MEEITYGLRLRLLRGKPFWGPGVMELLRGVDETGSLHTAAARMGMSYSKAWRIVKEAEKALGFPITTRRIGGAGGGSSELTEEGRVFIQRFDDFQRALWEDADALFRQFFPGNNNNQKNGAESDEAD